ncbi:MAG: hypothetical protein AAF828_00700 [Bacteroidota bacterium]
MPKTKPMSNYQSHLRSAMTAKNDKQQVDFSNGQRLLIQTGEAGQESIELLAPGGDMVLQINFTEAGSTITLSGDTLKVKAKEKVEITGPVVDIHAKDELRIRSGGDLHQIVKNDTHSVARIQNITADLGNVNIKANDFVRLNGERVHLNCEES